MIPITTLFFDLGGVLFDNGTQRAINYLAETYGFEKTILNEIFYGSSSWDLRAGKINSTKYWEKISTLYPFTKEIDLKEIWYSFYKIKIPVWEIILSLSKKYVLGIISGNIEERVAYLENKYKFSYLFKYFVYSYNYGLVKPDKKLFEIAIDLSNSKPEEMIFIDDHEDCCETIKTLGSNAILFQNTDNFEKDLLKYGIQFS